MTTLFFNRAGVDFDTLFERDPAGVAIPGFLDELGNPLLFTSIEFGSKIPDVEHYHPDSPHLDVTHFWAGQGTVIYVNPGALPSTITDTQVGGPPSVGAGVSFTLLRDGTSDWTPSLGGGDNWLTPQSSTAGDIYDVRFSLTQGNSAGTLSGTLHTWMQMNEARGMVLTVVTTSSGARRARRVILVEIRRRSDLVVVYSHAVTMIAEADIS